MNTYKDFTELVKWLKKENIIYDLYEEETPDGFINWRIEVVNGQLTPEQKSFIDSLGATETKRQIAI